MSDKQSLFDLMRQYVRDASPGGVLNPEVTGQGVLDAAAMATMPVPVAGDLVGLLADANRMRDPSERTPMNAALMALGVLPLVPSMASIKPLRVIVRATDDPKTVQSLARRVSGDFELTRYTAQKDPFIKDWVSDKLHEMFGPKYDHFFRFTNNPDEINLARQGVLRNSKNYANNIAESGLSVASGPHYSINGYKYGYKVRGTPVGRGSDGELLLNPKNLEVLDKKLRTASSISTDGYRQIEAELSKHGLSNDFFRRPIEVVWP